MRHGLPVNKAQKNNHYLVFKCTVKTQVNVKDDNKKNFNLIEMGLIRSTLKQKQFK